jgi:hypothetical protein
MWLPSPVNNNGSHHTTLENSEPSADTQSRNRGALNPNTNLAYSGQKWHKLRVKDGQIKRKGFNLSTSKQQKRPKGRFYGVCNDH